MYMTGLILLISGGAQGAYLINQLFSTQRPEEDGVHHHHQHFAASTQEAYVEPQQIHVSQDNRGDGYAAAAPNPHPPYREAPVPPQPPAPVARPAEPVRMEAPSAPVPAPPPEPPVARPPVIPAAPPVNAPVPVQVLPTVRIPQPELVPATPVTMDASAVPVGASMALANSPKADAPKAMSSLGALVGGLPSQDAKLATTGGGSGAGSNNNSRSLEYVHVYDDYKDMPGDELDVYGSEDPLKIIEENVDQTIFKAVARANMSILVAAPTRTGKTTFWQRVMIEICRLYPMAEWHIVDPKASDWLGLEKLSGNKQVVEVPDILNDFAPFFNKVSYVAKKVRDRRSLSMKDRKRIAQQHPIFLVLDDYHSMMDLSKERMSAKRYKLLRAQLIYIVTTGAEFGVYAVILTQSYNVDSLQLGDKNIRKNLGFLTLGRIFSELDDEGDLVKRGSYSTVIAPAVDRYIVEHRGSQMKMAEQFGRFEPIAEDQERSLFFTTIGPVRIGFLPLIDPDSFEPIYAGEGQNINRPEYSLEQYLQDHGAETYAEEVFEVPYEDSDDEDEDEDIPASASPLRGHLETLNRLLKITPSFDGQSSEAAPRASSSLYGSTQTQEIYLEDDDELGDFIDVLPDPDATQVEPEETQEKETICPIQGNPKFSPAYLTPAEKDQFMYALITASASRGWLSARTVSQNIPLTKTLNLGSNQIRSIMVDLANNGVGGCQGEDAHLCWAHHPSRAGAISPNMEY
jgi:hypothetical protein